MDNRAAKLAIARKKLKDHQEKKSVCTQKEETSDTVLSCEHIDEKTESDATKHEVNLSINNVNNKEENMLEQFNHSTNINETPVNINSENSFANVTEILISNKTNLEMQNKELCSKLAHLEHIYSQELNENNLNKQKICALEVELNDKFKKLTHLMESISTQDSIIVELRNQIKSLTDDKNNLKEQHEFSQTILTAKEMEVSQLSSQLNAVQNQLDVTTLQLQQLTSDTNLSFNHETNNNNEILMEKIAMLKKQLEESLKEKDLITTNYEHYVSKLNEQLNLQISKNETLSIEVNGLYNRESSLIEQIGQMEIRMQNYRRQTEAYAESYNMSQIQELQDKVAALQAEVDASSLKHSNLLKENEINLRKMQEYNQPDIQEYCHDNISLTKLNADITSNKVAAQRATEQNKKLKMDVEDLEQIVVKLGKDKLELTEKLSHEKQLNKQLMLKLAEIDEATRQMQTKLIAKDEEMIRLQSNYRDIEYKHETLLDNLLLSKEIAVIKKINVQDAGEITHIEKEEFNECSVVDTSQCSGDCETNSRKEIDYGNELPKEDAMLKLQERFLNIMDQVANLSDEKHRLEHIILQLQTETDTICEYIALYQQQRSLLKKRDEERSAQMKLFQIECDEIKCQLEELSRIFLKLAQDKDLSALLRIEPRHDHVAKIKNLLEILLNSTLINSKCMSLELKNFYPCSCCSGKLIDI